MNNANSRKADDSGRISVFELHYQYFGLDILKLREVIPLPRFTPLPNANEVFLGVFNLRGEIFPLMDISPVLGFEEKKLHADDMVMLVQNRDVVFGFVVDRIHGVVNYSPAEVKPPRGIVNKPTEEFLSGVLERPNRLIYILDVNQLLTNRKLMAHS